MVTVDPEQPAFISDEYADGMLIPEGVIIHGEDEAPTPTAIMPPGNLRTINDEIEHEAHQRYIKHLYRVMCPFGYDFIRERMITPENLKNMTDEDIKGGRIPYKFYPKVNKGLKDRLWKKSVRRAIRHYDKKSREKIPPLMKTAKGKGEMTKASRNPIPKDKFPPRPKTRMAMTKYLFSRSGKGDPKFLFTRSGQGEPECAKGIGFAPHSAMVRDGIMKTHGGSILGTIATTVIPTILGGLTDLGKSISRAIQKRKKKKREAKEKKVKERLDIAKQKYLKVQNIFRERQGLPPIEDTDIFTPGGTTPPEPVPMPAPAPTPTPTPTPAPTPGTTPKTVEEVQRRVAESMKKIPKISYYGYGDSSKTILTPYQLQQARLAAKEAERKGVVGFPNPFSFPRHAPVDGLSFMRDVYNKARSSILKGAKLEGFKPKHAAIFTDKYLRRHAKKYLGKGVAKEIFEGTRVGKPFQKFTIGRILAPLAATQIKDPERRKKVLMALKKKRWMRPIKGNGIQDVLGHLGDALVHGPMVQRRAMTYDRALPINLAQYAVHNLVKRRIISPENKARLYRHIASSLASQLPPSDLKAGGGKPVYMKNKLRIRRGKLYAQGGNVLWNILGTIAKPFTETVIPAITSAAKKAAPKIASAAKTVGSTLSTAASSSIGKEIGKAAVSGLEDIAEEYGKERQLQKLKEARKEEIEDWKKAREEEIEKFEAAKQFTPEQMREVRLQAETARQLATLMGGEDIEGRITRPSQLRSDLEDVYGLRGLRAGESESAISPVTELLLREPKKKSKKKSKLEKLKKKLEKVRTLKEIGEVMRPKEEEGEEELKKLRRELKKVKMLKEIGETVGSKEEEGEEELKKLRRELKKALLKKQLESVEASKGEEGEEELKKLRKRVKKAQLEKEFEALTKPGMTEEERTTEEELKKLRKRLKMTQLEKEFEALISPPAMKEMTEEEKEEARLRKIKRGIRGVKLSKELRELTEPEKVREPSREELEEAEEEKERKALRRKLSKLRMESEIERIEETPEIKKLKKKLKKKQLELSALRRKKDIAALIEEGATREGLEPEEGEEGEEEEGIGFGLPRASPRYFSGPTSFDQYRPRVRAGAVWALGKKTK